MRELEPRTNENVKVWRPEGFEGLEVYRNNGSSMAIERQYQDEYTIAAGLAGPALLVYRGEKIVHPGPCTQVYQPGEIVTAKPTEGGVLTAWFLRVHPDAMQHLIGDLWPERRALPYFPSFMPRDETLNSHLLHSLKVLFARFEAGADKLTLESQLLRVVKGLVQHLSDAPAAERRPGREHKAVRLIKSYLREHYGEGVTLDDLAALTGLNKSYLLEVFRRDVGASPHGYLTCVRLARAKDLLCQGVPIAQTAYQTGFVDQSHLNRLFKKHVFVTPGQYRRDNLRPKQRPWHLDSRVAGE